MTGFYRLPLLIGFGVLACSGGDPAPVAPGPGTGESGNSTGTAGNGTGGGNSMSGAPGQAGSGTGGSPAAGAGTGGAPMGGAATGGGGASPAGGTGGTGTGGSGGSGSGGGSGGKIMVTAAPKLYTHMTGTRPAGVDTRLPVIMGKLIVNLDVDDGNLNDYALKHGFHVYGAKFEHCKIAETEADYGTKGRDFNGNCRLETFDGMDHDASVNITPAASVSGMVKTALADLASKYGEEGWGYFLDAGGNVRWEDVGITGYSHGATSAVRWSKKVKLWRAVARSGPRDNICGSAFAGKTCPDAVVSSWLSETSATPVENVFSLGGKGDSQYGDFVFANTVLKLPGTPTDVSTAAPPAGNNQLFITGAHDPFTDKKFWPVFDQIYGMPKENVDYANTH